MSSLGEPALRRRIRLLLLAFIVGLVGAGITAIPVKWEIDWLASMVPGNAWIERVREGIHQGYGRYPFLAYGTDWLAFGHFVIALAFIGPLRDPVRNVWVVEWGMLACILVVPTALVFGSLREIPLLHRFVDCAFGLVGIVPLWLVRRYTLQLATLTT